MCYVSLYVCVRENMEEETETTTIRLNKTTVKKLKQVGRKGETYDQIINQLLDKEAAA